MLGKHLSGLILKELGYPPTNDQNIVIEKLGGFIVSERNDQLFLIRGYAGTGKTTVIAALVNVLIKMDIEVVLLAPTGRAAKVLAQYSNATATTIHKKIYRQKSGSDYNVGFDLNVNLHKNAIFIVDEASMIGDHSVENNFFGSGNLLGDLIEFVNNGYRCKIILSGDVAQLPPVGTILSPALREQEIERYGKSVIVTALRDVIRQTEDSGILQNATNIRAKLANKDYSPPFFDLGKHSDIQSINGSDFVEQIESAYSKFGREQVSVITRTNKSALIYNTGIRQSVLWHEDELVSGEMLMVVRNNYFWTSDIEDQKFIANGDTIQLKRIRKITERYGFRFADATITLLDSKDIELDVIILLDTLHSSTADITDEQSANLYHAVESEYADIKSKRKRFQEIRKNPYFNALRVKYAYAITCHKAQGGQWDAVFVDQGYFVDDMLNLEYLRWLYTAVTRAKTQLFLVNFKSSFFV
ncbi:MAG TPA: AAA family ATPase [Salinivirgaceae bacterium]|nr:AAA family ATPase [Salinivirgaceae bacterium]